MSLPGYKFHSQATRVRLHVLEGHCEAYFEAWWAPLQSLEFDPYIRAKTKAPLPRGRRLPGTAGIWNNWKYVIFKSRANLPRPICRVTTRAQIGGRRSSHDAS